ACAVKRYGHLLAATPAERKDTLGIAVRAHLQPIEILPLIAEARVRHLDVVVALFRKGKIDARVEPRAGAIVAPRELFACTIQNAQHRIDSRPAAPRLDFEHAPLPGLT